MQQYFTKVTGKQKKSVAHLWDGEDTICKQWSLNLKATAASKNYKPVDAPMGKPICKVCQQISNTGVNSYYEKAKQVNSANANDGDLDRIEYIVALLKSKISWRSIKESGDESEKKLIALQEQSNPLMINPEKDAFYIGCEKLLNELLSINKNHTLVT